MNIHRSAHVHDPRREQRKEATTRTGATAPTGRDTPKGSKTKSPFCVVLKTYHLTGNHHKTCLKHFNFLNRKLCVQLLPTWNTMATVRGTGNRRKNKRRHNKLRQGSKHGTYNTLSSSLWKYFEISKASQSICASRWTISFPTFLRGVTCLSRIEGGDRILKISCPSVQSSWISAALYPGTHNPIASTYSVKQQILLQHFSSTGLSISLGVPDYIQRRI